MKNVEYWIWLSRIEGISSKILIELLNKYKSPKILWNKTKEELIEDGIKEDYAEKLIDSSCRTNLDKYLNYMKKNNIEIISLYDTYYPDKLKVIYDPPIVLYVKGNKKILNNKSIAIVGCRLPTAYGKNIANNMAYNLSVNNINIISGLARGIDTCSHIGCLKANGTTIAVVGCGLDRVYPEENKSLFENIIKSGGAIVSEYVIGTKPLAKNFPRRNRIISGLSNGVIVIEAKEKSGTLITADFALEQGKDVYAVPGNITSINSYGTNELIKQGAKVATSVQDILEDFGQ